MFATAKYLGSIKLQARSPFEKLQNQQSFKIDCMIYAQGFFFQHLLGKIYSALYRQIKC